MQGETRGFNGLNGSTFSMRKKEAINDYRYFPEPDLPPTLITDADVARVRENMPELPESLYKRFTEEYGLNDYDASVLIDDKESAFYFEELVRLGAPYKTASNWVTVTIRGFLNERALHLQDFPLSAEQIAEIIELIQGGSINHSIASQKLFPAMIASPELSAKEVVEKLNLATSSDTGFIEELVKQVLSEFPDKVAEFKAGENRTFWNVCWRSNETFKR